MKNKDETIISTLLSGRAGKKYEGKEVVVLNGKVYLLPENDKEAGEFFNDLVIKNPKSTPTLVDVPKRGTYILISTL